MLWYIYLIYMISLFYTVTLRSGDNDDGSRAHSPTARERLTMWRQGLLASFMSSKRGRRKSENDVQIKVCQRFVRLRF
jgi:hypothetical protein